MGDGYIYMDELDGWIDEYKEWVNLINESWWIDGLMDRWIKGNGWIWWMMETDNELMDESNLLKG